MGHKVRQALCLLVLLHCLALLLGLVDTVDDIEMLVLERSLHSFSVGTCVRTLIEWVEVWRRLATKLDLGVMEVVVGVSSWE